MVVAPQNLPPFAAYTDDDAWQFFLGPDGAGGADWEFMVEGHSLPVHSAVLAPQSRVLTDVLEEWQAAGCRPAPRATSNAHLLDHSTQLQVVMSDSIVLARESQSLAGFTLKRVAHFLRFAYWPDQLAALRLDLPGAAKTISAAARLAHQLDMPVLLGRLEERMDEAVSTHQATLHRLIDWAAVAEECGLDRLWAKCVREVALLLARSRDAGCTPRTMSSQDLRGKLRAASIGKVASSKELAPGADASQTAVHDVTLLKALTPKSQLAVMAALLAALRGADEDPAAHVPAEESLGDALPAIWRLESEPGSPLAEAV